jgi:predicted metal-dependent enzyme (double-stranded beta helix superfamily)
MISYKLDELVNNIKTEINNGKSLCELGDCITNYRGNDWKDYKKYCRNKIYQDDTIEILLICWNHNQQSGIHDHPDNGCILTILEGSLVEEVYRKINNKLVMIKSNNISKGNISYQIGSYGLHNIVNSKDRSVSLHIYSPPNYKPIFHSN